MVYCVHETVNGYSSFSMLDIIAIGDVAEDTFLEVNDAAISCDINKEHCQVMLPYGMKIPVSTVTKVLATGNASNHIIGAVKLGAKGALVSVVGSDTTGEAVRKTLKSYKVKTSYIHTERNSKTNTSVILQIKGERTILVHHVPRVYHLPRLPKARCVFFSSVSGDHTEYSEGMLAYVKKTKAMFVFSPGTMQLKLGLTALQPLLRASSALFLNKEEGEVLVGKKRTPKALLDALVHETGGTVYMTDGEKGAYAATKDMKWFCPPFPARIVERTGCGDAFASGVVMALLKEKTIEEAMRWGSVNAAGVLEHVGPHAGLRTGKEIEALLKEAGASYQVKAL